MRFQCVRMDPSLAEQFRPDSASRAGDRSTPWVMRRMQLFETLASHMRVDLRGREVAVTQEHLHDTQIRTVVEQVGCERMAQRMRREFFRDAGLACVALDDVPESLARHSITTPCREQ